MLKTDQLSPVQTKSPEQSYEQRARTRVAVIWIDWYAYHVARFVGITSHAQLTGAVAGVELVGGVGVHRGQRFREELPPDLAVETLFPERDWQDVPQLAMAVRLWRHLQQLDPEVVLVPGYYTLPALAAALWARVHRRKSVLMTESTREDHVRSPWKEACKGALIRSLFNWAVTGGRRHVEYLHELGFAKDRILAYYDVVDNDELYHQSQRLRRESNGKSGMPGNYFLYVGRLAPEKNIQGLISNYLAYRRSGGQWSLVLVGDGPERRMGESLAGASAYREDIHFVGHKSSLELPGFYAFARCFVLPSTREPWGLVVNEAMACGLPVIVSNRCGCAVDLVTHFSNGLVFDPSNEGELSGCFSTIESFSEKQLLRMSTRALEQISNYSPSRFGEQIAKIALA